MKGFIFDMDGVIFDTENIWKDALYKANEIYNLDLDENYRKSICGKDENIIRKELKDLFPNLNVTEYREYIINYVKNEIKNGNYNIKYYFLELIHILKSKNFKIALATSSNKDRAEILFKNKNIDINMFDVCIFSNDISIGKPNPEIFIKASNKLSLNPTDCYVIEDSINGLVAAINGGFIPVMVIDLIEPTECINDNVKYIFNNLKEILNIL